LTVQLVPHATRSAMRDLADDYLNHCRARSVSPRTDQQYGYALHTVFLPWCAEQGIERIEDFDRRAADRYSASLLNHRKANGQPLSKYSVATWTRPVRQMLAWAKAEGELVAGQPQLPRRPKPIRDVLSRQEIECLEQALVHERDKVIIRIFADCGLRLEELARLTATDVIRSGRQAHLRILHGKRDRMREVPVAPSLLRRIERLIELRPVERETDHVFVAYRRNSYGVHDPLSSNAIYQVVKEAVVRARITKRVYPHLMRHSWMTEMVRRGMHPMQLSLIAGASLDVIMECYTHLTKFDAYDSMMRALTDLNQRPVR
jgi:site-specific recombinase XerD